MYVDAPVIDQTAQAILEFLLDDCGDIDLVRGDIDVVDAVVGEVQVRAVGDGVAHERQQVGAGTEIQGIGLTVCAVDGAVKLGAGLERIDIASASADDRAVRGVLEGDGVGAERYGDIAAGGKREGQIRGDIGKIESVVLRSAPYIVDAFRRQLVGIVRDPHSAKTGGVEEVEGQVGIEP